MSSSHPVDLLNITEVVQRTRVSIDRVLAAAGKGEFPLFIEVPDNMEAHRIDLQSNDLAARTEFFKIPAKYENLSPRYLRLKPANCDELASNKEVKATEFPYAICLEAGEGSSFLEYVLSRSAADKIIEIPPNQEFFPTEMNSALIGWRLFHPKPEDFSVFVPLTVTPDMVIARSDYLDRITKLRQTGHRKQAGKSNTGYVERFERPRRLLADIAEQVAKDNPDNCDTFSNWAATVYDLRESRPFEELHQEKSEIKLRWINETLRLKFEYLDKKPVRKSFTKPEQTGIITNLSTDNA